MQAIRISTKHQVVIPKDVRGILDLKAGDEVMFVARNRVVYLIPKPRSFVKAMKGLAKANLKYPKAYLRKEKASW